MKYLMKKLKIQTYIDISRILPIHFMNNNKEKMERIVSNLKIYDHLSEDY